MKEMSQKKNKKCNKKKKKLVLRILNSDIC